MESVIYERIGQRIREAREEAKWSQSTLGEKIGMTRSSVANIESGRQKVQIHVLYHIAHALRISVYDLLPETDKEVKTEELSPSFTALADQLLGDNMLAVKDAIRKTKYGGTSNESH